MTQTHTPPQTKHKRVVIVGGGFAGLSLARELRKQPIEVRISRQEQLSHVSAPSLPGCYCRA